MAAMLIYINLKKISIILKILLVGCARADLRRITIVEEKIPFQLYGFGMIIEALSKIYNKVSKNAEEATIIILKI